MSEKQRTIQSSITVSGTGLHTGVEVKLKFQPAPAGHGVQFRRIDLEGHPIVLADCDFVHDTNRGTTLANNGAMVGTVEHVMAAIKGMEIDNLLIDIDNFETPIKDGSSKYFTEALQKAGIKEQEEDKKVFNLDKILTYTDPENGIEIIAVPSDEFRVSVMIDFGTEVLSTQNAAIQSISEFNTNIAICRTFVFLHELEYLLQKNLIKGGDLNNAIVFVNRVIEQEELDRLAKLFNKPSVQVLRKGILNNVDLYFENEPARHKLLDVIGDLSLAGVTLNAHIIARRPGHKANVEFAKIIKQYIMDKEKNRFNPPFDLSKTPIYDINRIKKILPHRPPFLLVDKVIDMDDQHVIGIKNVTMNEDFFVGHFPDKPVMPGVLQIEAMAQTGGIFMLSTVPDPENYLTFFLKIDNVKFRNIVVPGDTLVFSLKLLSPIRRGLCHMSGIGYVNDKPVIEAEMLAQISKNNNQ
ncbi:MAG: bifunctional UDP-3-O-[3-hydroxymyristoyl] N-acetylglucosamine deacetylase/3-hydroxyacyl-ACP dehydratase [Bacteroidales bacterium]|nr:bifunctional UDP-3-O-[3-hydroxymyristoyl] N-acetylglucosamine deacetylase/3-hydroxyacyl-ACP dehydratase [Bacteroidales bacterium]MCF8405645.1 bifunctional UDP-3-O-[3-hydroxymyristoyl] N-acetylglucosamine deacetylase/3-hydroxyacyl-ACP dehydratase [Bacteroidales bacterium]